VSNTRILLVDDDPNILDVIRMRLELGGYEVVTSSDPRDAFEIFRRHMDFPVLLTDQMMDGMRGVELMERCRDLDSTVQTIIFTAFGTIGDAVDAIKAGAYAYVTKPVDEQDLLVKIENAIEKRNLLVKVARLERLVEKSLYFEEMIAASPSMKAVVKQILQVAPTDATITVLGESGTGKELVARAVHRHSLRSKGPFIAVNCAALPENLIESEFFGYVKGAFTGAVSSKDGVFAMAHKGTLFLDEIGEMSEAMQAKLLRVIETREVKPLGAMRERAVDVRLIVATNRDLRSMVAEKRFREDLFYRIHVVPIYLPPLRDRREDLAQLVYHFFSHFAEVMGKKVLSIEQKVIDAFYSYEWPGNVRELKNIVEYMATMAVSSTITGDLLENTPLARLMPMTEHLSLKEAKGIFVKKYLQDLFSRVKGNVSLAARLAGYSRPEFYKLMEKHGIDPERYRKRA